MTIHAKDLINRPLKVVGETITLKAVGDGEWSAFHLDAEKGGGPPLHTHPWEEAYVVTRGKLRVSQNGVISDLGPGDSVTIPANCPHAYSALEANTQVQVIFSSRRPVAFFRELHEVTDIPEVLRRAEAHEVVCVGGPVAA